MRRSWSFITLLVVLTMFLTQCAAPAAPAEPAAQTGEEAAAGSEAAAGEPIELRLWQHQNPSFLAANEEIVKRFEAVHPGVTVKIETILYDDYLQTLQTSMAAGTEADIMELFGSWVCSFSDRLAELPETVMTYNEAQEKLFKAPTGRVLLRRQALRPAQRIQHRERRRHDQHAHVRRSRPDLSARVDQHAGFAGRRAEAAVRYEDGQMTRSGFHFITGDGLAFQFWPASCNAAASSGSRMAAA